MAVFKDYLKANRLQPMDMRGAHKAMIAELARPRLPRRQVIVVRNAQEAALIASMIDEARSTREDIQRIHRQAREGAEE